MHNLRDHLLKAGLVTKEQVARAESEKSGKKKKRRPPKKNGEQRAKDQPVNRMIDLSDPQRLQLAQAIESHRVRGETKGEIAFNFTLRDGRIRKMFVSKETQDGLEKGSLAIVEHGEVESHIIVSAEALPAITLVDREAIRFHNSH
jgi:uncharacterized protein YaiL (DUF2058 family)